MIRIPNISTIKLICYDIICRSKTEIAQDWESVIEYVTKAIIEGDAKDLSRTLALQIRHQIAQTQAPIA